MKNVSQLTVKLVFIFNDFDIYITNELFYKILFTTNKKHLSENVYTYYFVS